MSAEVSFTFLDYFFFAIVFIVSITIGLCFALSKTKLQSVEEYFFGGKKLGILPVASSIIATGITGSIIGQSMEVYAYGLHNFMYIVIVPIWGFLLPLVFLPIFYDLQIMSSFTYLELRFDKTVKNFASAIYVITGFFFIPLTIYVPALAFQEVTGINLYVICIISGLLCILYTAMGGFRAVVWTDVFQFSLILFSTFVIFVVGLVSVGGFQNIWNALDRGGRLHIFKTDLNMETRGSIWAYISSTSIITAYQLNLTQSSIQRYISLGSLKKAKHTMLIQCFFCSAILLMQFTIGAVIYATYEECDPLTAGIVKKLDQIFPYFVQEKASFFMGFNGIFIAGTFSAGLSTTSTLLNTMSGTIYMDFLGSKMKNVSERSSNIIMKIIVVIVGVVGISLIFLIERLGTIFSITIQCITISAVGVFGLFCSGMIFRNINSKGVKCGVLTSMLVAGILVIGGIKKNPDPVLPLRVDGCDFFNSTLSPLDFQQQNITSISNIDAENVSWIFRINFQFFGIIALIINIVVGSFVSFITGGNKIKDEKLLARFLRKNTTQDKPQETSLLPSY